MKPGFASKFRPESQIKIVEELLTEAGPKVWRFVVEGLCQNGGANIGLLNDYCPFKILPSPLNLARPLLGFHALIYYE